MAKIVTLKNSNDEEVYPVTQAEAINGLIYADSEGVPTPITGDITSARIADGAVTADKIDWSSVYAYIKYAGAVFTTSSTTLTDKISITGVPKGTYLIRANTNWFNNDGGANGECNMRLAKVDGGTTSYSDISSILLPPVNWTGIQNVFDVIWTISNDNTTVKVQTSVNWPARGTYYCRATSYLMLIRVGTLHP